MNMKISAQKIIVLSLIAGFITGAIPASAFTSIVRGSEGMGKASVSELAGKEVAVLSNNPLHFLKGWRDNFLGLFISDAFEGVLFELKQAGERAGEVRKLADWASDNTEGLSAALVQYKDALQDFEVQLNTLQKSDLSENAEADIADMVSRLLTQFRFVDDMRDLSTDSADQVIFKEIEQILTNALRFIALELDDVKLFSARVANVVTQNADAATAVRVIGILAKLVQEIAGIDEANAFVAAIADARTTLIANLANAMKEEASPVAMKAVPATMALGSVPAEANAALTVTEIVDQLADETLKIEIYALLQS